MSTCSEQVVRLDWRDLRRAVDVMVRAYEHDPMMEYLFPPERRNMRTVRWFVATGIKYGLHYGDVYTTSGVNGVAIWLPPDHPEVKLAGMLRSGMIWLPIRLGRKVFRRLMHCLDITYRVHSEVMTGPHWYLYELAVEPDCQGKGIGSALIAPVIASADSEGLPCYLETFTDEGIVFYRKHGFEVVREYASRKGGPVCRYMVREPKPRA